MTTYNNRVGMAAALMAALALGKPMLGQNAAPATPPTSRPAQKSTSDLLKPADRPLDERINPGKITETDPPPLPQQVVVPMPPSFQISQRPEQVPIDPDLWRKANAALKKGLDYLRAQQDSSGQWMKAVKAEPTDQAERSAPVAKAVTALALKALVQADPNALKGEKPDQNILQALRFITQARRPDGSFDSGSLSNYVNSSVLSALSAIGDRDSHDDIIALQKMLMSQQWDQGEGVSPRQDWFGGSGYGDEGRPDLSNTQMMLDALYDSGLSPDEPAFQKALCFASRTQNFKATNSAPWAGTDGGFIYTPANGGESKASEVAGEGVSGEILAATGQPRSLRSYGAMTYAGFKSMLYAGLSPDDVRVRAAFDWIRNHWTFDENPGIGQLGLYYYYHTIARALFIAQQDIITDTKGGKHNWREELIQALIKRQRDDGSWVNQADRWLEGQPSLVTCYGVLALEEALKPVRD